MPPKIKIYLIAGLGLLFTTSIYLTWFFTKSTLKPKADQPSPKTTLPAAQSTTVSGSTGGLASTPAPTVGELTPPLNVQTGTPAPASLATLNFQLSPDWNLIGINFKDTSPSTIAQTLGADLSKRSYVLREDNTWQKIANLTDLVFSPGLALYIKSTAGEVMTIKGQFIYPEKTDTVIIKLRKGWNMIANPFNKALIWQLQSLKAGTKTYSHQEALDSKLCSPALKYNLAEQKYDEVSIGTSLDKGQVLFMQCATEVELTVVDSEV